MNNPRYVELRKNEDNPSFGFNIKGGYGASPITVWRVEGGSIADRYGLKTGDEILQANGVDFTRIDHGEALSLLKNRDVLCLHLRTPRGMPGTPSMTHYPLSSSTSSPATLAHQHHQTQTQHQLHQLHHHINSGPLPLPPGGALRSSSSASHLTHSGGSHLLVGGDYPLIPILDEDEPPLVYSNAEFYTWVDRLGAPVAPPRMSESWPKRSVDLEVQPGQNLGLMIRGGSEFGLGIYVTGVDPGSVAERAGLQRGDEILEVNGRPFTSITHDKAVAILKSSRKMNMLVSFIGKIPADLTFEPRVKLVEDDIDKCTNILQMIEEKARTLLTKSEHSRFTFYREEYQQGFLPVHTFVRILLELLSTHEKYTLLTEVREIIRPQDRNIFDDLIYKPVHSNNYGIHMDSNRPPHHGVNGVSSQQQHLTSEMAYSSIYNNTPTKMDSQGLRTSPSGTTPIVTYPGPGGDAQGPPNGIMVPSEPLHPNTPAIRYRVRIKKSKPTLGIAIEGGVNTPHRLPRVINVNADGSAYSSNLKPGQVLLSVDSKKLDGLSHEEIARLIQESYADATKNLIEFVVVEAKNTQRVRHQTPGGGVGGAAGGGVAAGPAGVLQQQHHHHHGPQHSHASAPSGGGLHQQHLHHHSQQHKQPSSSLIL